ncbi:hypothetical protein DL769_000712 [Monosporascus sp. CRB-8-3]|nr:hypothetical protein DL769_000712 [Monosporascus sp. CRB-8-3]
MDSEITFEETPALSGLKNPERDVDWSSGNGIVDPFGANPKVVYRSGAAVSGTLLGDTVSLNAHHPAVAQEGAEPPFEAEDWDKFFEEYARDHAQEQPAEDSLQTSQPTPPTGATGGAQLHTPSSSGHSDTKPPNPMGEYFPALPQEPVSQSLLIHPQLIAFDHALGAQQLATPPTNANSETQPPNLPDENFLADWHGPVAEYPFMDIPFSTLDHEVNAQAELTSGIAQSGVHPPHPACEAQDMWSASHFPVVDLQLPTWLTGQTAQQQGTLSHEYCHMDQVHNVPQIGVGAASQWPQLPGYPPDQGFNVQNGAAVTPQASQFFGDPSAEGPYFENWATVAHQEAQLHGSPLPQSPSWQNGAAVPPQGSQLPGDPSAEGHPVPLDPDSRDGIMRRIYVDPKDGDTLYVLDVPVPPAPGQAGGVVGNLLPMEGLRLTKHHRHALPIVIERWLQSRRNQKKLAKARRQKGGKWQVRVVGLST